MMLTFWMTSNLTTIHWSHGDSVQIKNLFLDQNFEFIDFMSVMM